MNEIRDNLRRRGNAVVNPSRAFVGTVQMTLILIEISLNCIKRNGDIRDLK